MKQNPFTKKYAIPIFIIATFAIILSCTVMAKYIIEKQITTSTTKLSINVNTEYTIEKTKLWNSLKALTTKPTTLNFVTGKAVPSTASIVEDNNSYTYSEGIQDDDLNSNKIGVYQDGTTVYIAPMDGSSTDPADNEKEIYAPEDSFKFLCGDSGYTGLDKSLTDVDFANLDTSRVTNMKQFFYDSYTLKSINFGEKFKTDNVENMWAMFSYCSVLENLDVTGFNTSNVTNMHDMFYACPRITTLDLSNFDTSKVTDMEMMFSGDKALTTITLSEKFKTDEVTTMECMFRYCNKLTELTLPKTFTAKKVTDMHNMFEDCYTLTSLDLSNFDTTALCLNNTSGMFLGALKLQTINFGDNFKTDEVTTMASMFYNCRKLTSLDVSNFNTEKVIDMSTMFYNCYGLSELDLSNFDTDAVIKMVNMFGGCDGLTTLDVSSFTGTALTSMTNMFYNCSKLTSLDLSNFNTPKASSTNFANSPFDGCVRLQSITLCKDFKFALPSTSTSGATSYLPTPSSTYITGATGTWVDTVTSKTYTPADLATFHNSLNETREYVVDTNLTYIINKTTMHSVLSTLTDKPTSLIFATGNEVSKLKGTDSNALVSLSTDGIQNDTSSTGKIGVFQSADKSTIYIAPMDETTHTAKISSTKMYTPEGTDSIYFLAGGDGNGAKYTKLGSSLKIIDVGNLDTSKSTTVYGMFWHQETLEEIRNLSVINTDNVIPTGFQLVFYSCYNLKEVDVSGFNISKATNLWSFFCDCRSLTSIKGLTNFDTSNATAYNYMFYNCKSLTSLDLSSFKLNTTASNISVGAMFYNCINLVTIYATSDFDLSSSNVQQSYTFSGSTKLKGGSGTTYNSSMVNAEYGRIDGGPSSTTPGYFTLKASTANASTLLTDINELVSTVVTEAKQSASAKTAFTNRRALVYNSKQ